MRVLISAIGTMNARATAVVRVKVLYQDSNLNVISGVAVNDTLVADGQSRLRPGARVEVLAAPPAAPVGDDVAGSGVQP